MTAGIGERPSGLRYPIGLLLALLIAVPLAGAGWFAVDRTRDASAAREQTVSIDGSVQRLVILSELRTRLLDERNWFLAVRGIKDVGLNLRFAEAVTGIDVQAELNRSQSDVDALLGELGMPEIEAQLGRIRLIEDRSLAEVGFEYDEVEAALSEDSDQLVDDLLERAGTLDHADQLVTALRILRASSTARQAISDEFTAFFSAQFSPEQSELANVRETIEERAIREDAEREIRRLAVDGSEVDVLIRAISTSPAAAVFDDAVGELLEEWLGDGGRSGEKNLTDVLWDIDGVAAVFTAGSDTTDLYFDLVDAAGRDALEASQALGTAAQEQQLEAVMWMTGLGLTSVLVGLGATRAIRRPVRRLANVADRISAGDSAARFGRAGGSVEIRAAGRALDGAAEHLQLAERQAKALADGDLENPVLTQTNAGELGASLQDAVSALATSMQEREEFRRRMTHEATHDGLTGIANRNASLAQLKRGLARTRRSGSLLAVLFIDLDDFKTVNDNHGHRGGDTVLRTVAQRMVNTVRAGDHVGRLGGDEFVVIAEPVESGEDATDLADRLMACFTEPIHCDGANVVVGASIGISLSDGLGPEPIGDDATDLLRDADLAVYKAKGAGRGRIELCDDELRSAIVERADLDRSIQRAVANHEFELHYQRIVEVPGGAVDGYEALIRWNRPEAGTVVPDRFIPMAEDGELIVAIDQWVLGAVARQIRAWDETGRRKGVKVSVNISGRHLSSDDFVDDVLTPLRDLGVDPSRIVIEVTESALLDDLDGAAAKLQTLRSHGIRIAIDDFGTGYTSLAHLKSLPIDILKIDRSFSTDESAVSLVQLIIDTGHLLGATVTAEGIETPAQADALIAMGADRLQGYLYGRPVPAEVMPLERAAADGGESPPVDVAPAAD